MKKLSVFVSLTLLGASVVCGPARAAGGTMPTCASGDPVVWENTSSKVYHMSGDKYYGTTKHGAYACKSAADGAGYHAAKSKGTSPKATSTALPGGAPEGESVPSPMASGTHHRHHHMSGTASPAPAPTAT